MTKPQPLYKSILDASNVIDTYSGGSIRVSKSLYTNKTTGFKVIESEHNNSNIKVTYTNDFPDIYGINISNIIVNVHNNTFIKYTFNLVDYFVKKDPFLDYITCYQLIVPLNDHDQVVLPGNIIFEPSNYKQQVYIRSISDISTLQIDQFENPSNIGYNFDEIQVFQNSNFTGIDIKHQRHAVVSTILSNQFHSIYTGLKYNFEESTRYASIVLLEDDHNTNKNQPLISIFQTFTWNGIVEPPTKNPDYRGIELISIEKYPESNIDNIVNRSSLLEFNFVMSANQSLLDIERVCILKYHLFSEEHVFMNVDVSHFISNATLIRTNSNESVYNSIIDLNDKLFNQLILTNYQGPISGAIKTSNIEWDPLSVFTPDIIYDNTNQGTYEIETIEVIPNRIKLRLIRFDHATNVPHTVHVTAVSDVDQTNTVTYTLYNITRTNYDYVITLDSLLSETTYNISITVNDGINSPFNEFIRQEITPPVGKKPTIHYVQVNFDSYATTF
tara:strand:- start:3478 stop:4980 length:1503 start_codon:yes stop_codon:yes gene_type:complete